jgi:hypothetical protein
MTSSIMAVVFDKLKPTIEVFKVTDTLIHKIHYTNIKLKPTIEVFKVTDTLIHKIHYTNKPPQKKLPPAFNFWK